MGLQAGPGSAPEPFSSPPLSSVLHRSGSGAGLEPLQRVRVPMPSMSLDPSLVFLRGTTTLRIHWPSQVGKGHEWELMLACCIDASGGLGLKSLL